MLSISIFEVEPSPYYDEHQRGQTTLQYAVDGENVEIVQLLIQHNAANHKVSSIVI